MKKISLLSLTVVTFFNAALFANDSNVCKKCQLVREFNKKNPSQYEYYDDYLKDKEAGLAEDIRFNENDLNKDEPN